METPNNEIRVTKTNGKMKVRRLFQSKYQKPNTVTAELEQIIETESHYPSQRINTSLQDNLYGLADFAIEKQSYKNQEIRLAWIDVPEGTEKDAVEAKLNQNEDACIYRMLSNSPILSDSDKYAVEQGIRSMDQYADSQVVRYPDNHDTDPGGLILDRNGKVQYRRTAFSVNIKEDLDYRSIEMDDSYMSSQISSEFEPNVSLQSDF